MKNFEVIRLILSLAAMLYLLIGIAGCKERRCDGNSLYADEPFLAFRLVDKYGVNQIAAWGHRYCSDSVYLTNLDGTLPPDLDIGGDGSIVFGIPIESADTAVLTFQYLLYLPDNSGKPKADVDTIELRYRHLQWCFENHQIYFNNSLQHDGQYTDYIDLVKK